MSVNIQKNWIGGLLAALAASLCCIAPLLAIFGGIGGAATYFNWIEPFRPYIIGLTILIFAISWYQKLVREPKQQADCCLETSKASFLQTKKSLFVITLFSALLIAFPYYTSLFFAGQKQTGSAIIVSRRFKYAKLTIKGMGCADCTSHIDGALVGLNGVSASHTSFEKAETIVRYDPRKISPDSIRHKITQIGYQVTCIKND